MLKRIKTLINLSQKAFGRYKLQIVVLTVLSFLGGLLEGVGVNALIPLLSFVMGENQGGVDKISQLVEKFFLWAHIAFTLKFLLIFIISLFIAKAIVLFFTSYISVKISADYENNLRKNLFTKTLEAKWPYLLKQKLGYLETILTVHAGQASTLLAKIGSMIIIMGSLFMYALVAINISFSITLIAFACGGLLLLVFKRWIYKIRAAASAMADAAERLAHYINENIFGMKTVKSMSIEEKVSITGQNLFDYLIKLKIRLYLLQDIPISFIQPISVIFISVIFAFYFKTSGFNFAALVAIVYLIQRIFQYIQQFQTAIQKIGEAAPYLKEVLDYENMLEKNAEKYTGKLSFKFNENLEFKNVGFSYNSEKAILNNINFAIKKGEMVGLVGPSGGGKTTIFDLVLRLFEPTGGEILLDGKNISDISIREWRKNIGYVSQDVFLMNDTVANNIRFYDSSISDEEITEAAKKADIHDFIESCPQKFETIIGERGIMFSVGQRQRIILARILARKPKFLLLDEATSALDNASEIKIQRIIERLRGQVTVLAVAHKLSTVMSADNILVLENGRISEQGNPKQLLQDEKSYFYKTYNIKK